MMSNVKNTKINFWEHAGIRQAADVRKDKQEMTWQEFTENLFYVAGAEGEITEKDDAGGYVPGTFIEKPKLNIANPSKIKKLTIKIDAVNSSDELGIESYYPGSDTVIDSISKSSPLYKEGVREFSRIFSVNGKNVSNWDEINEELSASSRPEIVFANNAGTYRTDENIESISFLSIDMDEEGGFEETKAFFKNYESFYHSTWKYSSKQPDRFRAIFPLKEPLSRIEFKLCMYVLKKLNEDNVIHVDPNCGNLSRAYYYPSIDPKSDLKPVTYRNEGQVLSKEIIFKIASENNISLPDHLHKEVSKNSHQKVYSVDFLGKEKSFFDNVTEPGQKYSDYIIRHQSRIDSLKTNDARNQFALEVLWNEINTYGEKADVENTIYFLYLASKQFSSRGIHSSESDTSTQIESLLSRAIVKVGQEKPHNIIEKYEKMDPEYTLSEKTMFWIQRANRASLVEDKLINGVTIPTKGSLLSHFKPEKSNIKINYNYDKIKQRNQIHIEKLGDGSIREGKFIMAVFENEIRLSEGKMPNLKLLTEFIYRFSKTETPTLIGVEQGKLAVNKDNFSTLLAKQVELSLGKANPDVKLTFNQNIFEKLCKEAEKRMINNYWLDNKLTKSPKNNGPIK
jgi:hypothetical protein